MTFQDFDSLLESSTHSSPEKSFNNSFSSVEKQPAAKKPAQPKKAPAAEKPKAKPAPKPAPTKKKEPWESSSEEDNVMDQDTDDEDFNLVIH